jgi:PKD repeat protein
MNYHRAMYRSQYAKLLKAFSILLLITFSHYLRGQGLPAVSCCHTCPLDVSTVANGGFADPTNNGFTGFSTDLIFRPTTSFPPLNPGEFTVCTDASLLPGSTGWIGTSHSVDGSMVFFGSADGITKRAWYQQVQVTNGRRYCFSAWFKGGCTGCNPTMKIAVNDGGVITILDTKTGTGWTHLCGIYNAANTATIELQVIIACPPGLFYCLDDINFNGDYDSNPEFSFVQGLCNTPTVFTSLNPSLVAYHYWDFGNGKISYDANPSCTYAAPGDFLVQHTVTGPCHSETTHQWLHINCCCQKCGHNLVFNGDFSDPNCNNGYYSSINYRNCSPPGIPVYLGYTETTDAAKWNIGWQGRDHTHTAGSRFMLIDGPTIGDGDKKVWFQSVNVDNTHNYCFSAWVKTLDNNGAAPVFQLKIGTFVVATSPALTDISADGWYKICGIYPATSTGLVELDIILLGAGGVAGNDAGLDDIVFSDQTPPVATYTYSIPTNCLDPVQFTWSGTDENVTHLWDFGDGTTSALASPTHSFSSGGSQFTVRHTVTNPCGSVYSEQTLSAACCCPCGKNFVVDGDFSQACNSSRPSWYWSDITNWYDCSGHTPSTLGGADGYSETSDASLWTSNWTGQDHTGNGSKILIVNGQTGGNKKVWFQNVNVQVNKNYCFSAWVKNLCNGSGGICTDSVIVDLLINGSAVATINLTNDIPLGSPWRKICYNYQSSGDGTIELAILNHGTTTSWGDDFGVDDILFTEKSPPNADFTFQINNCQPNTDKQVNFTSEEQSKFDKHSWTITNTETGAVYTSTDMNPFETLPKGPYHVVHTVSNTCGTTTFENDVYIDCCCTDCSYYSEMVVNGDFTDPDCDADYNNHIYTSELNFAGCTTTINGRPGYMEVTNANTYNNLWFATDHTGTPNSRFMMIDGPKYSEGDMVAWSQVVSVEKGKVYCFSAWVINMCGNVCSNPASFALRVGGKHGTIVGSIMDIWSTGTWVKVCGKYLATSTTDIEIDVISLASQHDMTASGNDCGIDDISFKQDVNLDADFIVPQDLCGNIQFTSKDRDNFITHNWYFGPYTLGVDQPVTDQDPFHNFTTNGPIQITHILTGPCGQSLTVTKWIYIRCGCCKGCGKNLITDGDFPAGNCAAVNQSDMPMVTCDPPFLQPVPMPCYGVYYLTANAQGWNPQWAGADHTGTPGSRFMAIDGPSTGCGDKKAWHRKLTLAPGTYCFSAWVRNICNGCDPNSYPSMSLWLNNFKADNIDNIDYQWGWVRLCYHFTITAETPAIDFSVQIAAKASMMGNDAGLDDVSISLDGPPVATFNYDIGSCTNVKCGSTVATVNFLPDETSGYITSQSWSCYNIATEQTTTSNVPVILLPEGTYTVTHIISNNCGSDTAQITVYVKCCCSPSCDATKEKVINGSFTTPSCNGDQVGPPVYTSDIPFYGCNTMEWCGFYDDLNHPEYVETTDASIFMQSCHLWHGLDHTKIPGSRFLLIDGPTSLDGDKVAWRQSVTVTKGVNYCFSAWVINVCDGCSGILPPSFKLRVTDQAGTHDIDVLSNYADYVWRKMCGSYSLNDGSLTESVIIEIVILAPASTSAYGNDAGIDDISFRESVNNDPGFLIPDQLCNPVHFKGNNTDPNITNSWTFSDAPGTVNNTAEVDHNFPRNGFYTVTHTIKTSCGTFTMSKSIYVKCCCSLCKPNLAVNGDFSNCINGFTTELNHYAGCTNTPGGMQRSGYAITNDAANWSGGWQSKDHTSETTCGNFMIIDGPDTAYKKVWKQTHRLPAGHTYCFSAWVRNLCSTCGHNEDPGMGLMVEYPAISKLIDHMDAIKYEWGWIKLCGTFQLPGNSPDTISVDFSVYLESKPSDAGNDAGLDDIVISDQSPPDATFAYNIVNCTDISFVPNETVSTMTHLWVFGDSASGSDNTSTDANPTHTYPGKGVYNVRHTAFTPCGSTTVTLKIYFKCCCNTCTVDSSANKPEQTRNGSFTDACYNKYHSDMRYHDCTDVGGSLGQPGFTETGDAHLWNSAWNATDHTVAANSKCLIMDGPTDNFKKAWYQNVKVEKGKTYCFGAWFKNMCVTCPNPPSFELRVNNTCPNSNHTATYGYVEGVYNLDDPGWIKVCGDYTADYDGIVEIDIYMLSNSDYAGNDGAIDDVSFAEKCCTQQVLDAGFTVSPCPYLCSTLLTFTSATQTSGLTHTWDFGDSKPQSKITTNNATATYNYGNYTHGPYNYTVTHTVSDGCHQVTFTMDIHLTGYCGEE